MTRYFPEVVEAVLANFPDRVVIDGEVIVADTARNTLDFEALQQRIHPAASRVKLLSEQTPAIDTVLVAVGGGGLIAGIAAWFANDARVVGVEPDAVPGRACLPAGHVPHPSIEDGPLPDATSPAWKAPTSGGSTGRPKLIVSGDASTVEENAGIALFAAENGCMVMPGPLFHNGPLVWATAGRPAPLGATIHCPTCGQPMTFDEELARRGLT